MTKELTGASKSRRKLIKIMTRQHAYTHFFVFTMEARAFVMYTVFFCIERLDDTETECYFF